jgi:hypothetical protein
VNARQPARLTALLAGGAFVAYLRPPRAKGSDVYDWQDADRWLFTEGPEPWIALAVALVAASVWANALWRLRKDEAPAARQQRRRKDGVALAKLGFQLAVPLLLFALWTQSSARAIVWDFEVAYLVAVVAAGGGWALYHSFQDRPALLPAEAVAPEPALEPEAPRPSAPPPRPGWAGRCIALGLLVPLGAGVLTTLLGLADPETFRGFSEGLLLLAFLVGLALMLAGLAGLALRRARVDPEARREAEAALAEARREAESDDTPTVLLDAPSGLPWESR